MTEKKCIKCEEVKPIDEFYRCKSRGYYQSDCKSCRRAYLKIYRGTPEFLERARIANKKRVDRGYFREYYHRPEVRPRMLAMRKKRYYDPSNRIKEMARWYANNSLKWGKIEKEPCAECGKEQSQMHHPDYSLPLLIVWLCSACHGKLTRKGITEITEEG